MSLVDANHAIEAFLDAIGEAQAMADRGKLGVDFDYLLRHAQELLDLGRLQMMRNLQVRTCWVERERMACLAVLIVADR